MNARGTSFPAIPQSTNGSEGKPPLDMAAISVRSKLDLRAKRKSGGDYFKAGKSTTSLMVRRLVSSITNRSMPIPMPPVGGIPCSSARM
jgi:hypothetical protein